MKKKTLIFFALTAVMLATTLSSAPMIEEEFGIAEIKSSSTDSIYSNATLVSDGYGGMYWNDGSSKSPSIAVDQMGMPHAVWQDYTEGPWGTDAEIMYSRYYPNIGWSSPVPISDGYGGVYWNIGSSSSPMIAIDQANSIHVVWHDFTVGPWGADVEIMYVNYTPTSGWSNVTIISDGYGGEYWNVGSSYTPSIDIDPANNIHVVWRDETDGAWGTDTEIMYVNYTPTSGWSNATVISDGYGGEYWNDGDSISPIIAVDQANGIHVVWHENTDGAWGTDVEIMYVNYTPTSGWSNATVISDGFGGEYWNDGTSNYPDLAVDQANNIHVVWYDYTDGAWGTDVEIMYVKYTPTLGWLNVSVISDGYGELYWNDATSYHPSIAVNDAGVHVAWNDHTDGPWGTDGEIMYVSNLYNLGWSAPIVISDGFEGSYWNDGNSVAPQIAAGGTGLYVIWQDYSDGPWTNISEDEIFCVTITTGQNIPGSFELTTDAAASDSDGTFNLKWTKAEGAAEYSIYITAEGVTTEYAVGLKERTFTVIGFEKGAYEVQVIAYNEMGSSPSNSIVITVSGNAFGEFVQDYGTISGMGLIAVLVVISGIGKKQKIMKS